MLDGGREMPDEGFRIKDGRVSALVFDFDGVLADSEGLHLRAYQDVLAGFGEALSSEAYYARYLGFDDEGVFLTLAEDRGWEMDARRLAALIGEKGRIYESFIAEGDVLYPGAAACVERMAAAFPLGIASGALRPEIEYILQRQRLDRHFQFIVASGDTPTSKPAPDPYRRAAELHGRPPAECLAIEDSPAGIESAKAAGLRCIGITHTYPREMLDGADAIVTALTSITPEFVQTLNFER